MVKRVEALWARNFAAALLVLLILKFALIYYSVDVGRGYVSPWQLLAGVGLFLGWDIVGAACLAALTVAFCLPWLAGPRGRADHPVAVLVSVVLQALHAIGGGLSFMAVITVGGFITKAGLDLVFLGNADEQTGIWSSVAHFATARNLSMIGGLGVVGGGTFVLAPRVLRHVQGRRARLAATFVGVLAATTTLVLPHLVTGELAGIRLHTYGLELSPGVELGESYLAPLLPWTQPRSAAIEDDWVLDFSPVAPQPEDVKNFPWPSLLAMATTSAPEQAEGVQNCSSRGLVGCGARPRRTNVIVVLLESVAAGYLTGASARMPFLRAAGAQVDGVYFEQHYSTWPQTTKAIFSIFCSEMPHPHHLPISATNPSIGCVSFSEVLRAHGYRTAFVTSADLAYERMIRFIRYRGFDVIHDMQQIPGNQSAWSNTWGIDERVAVADVLAQVDAARGQPFLVVYGMAVAHHPYFASAEHEASPKPTDRENYDVALDFIDARIEAIHEALVARGLDDETLLAVVSDHGEGFGQHVGSQSHGPTVYQENIHVPWAMRGPQLHGVRTRVTLPTSHLDVAPTLLGLLGIGVPCTMKGRNLAVEAPRRLVLFAGRPPSRQTGLVDGRYKYIREANGLEMVFDLLIDPGERRDLVRSFPAHLEAWRRRLDAWEAYSANLIENYSAIAAAHGCSPPAHSAASPSR